MKRTQKSKPYSVGLDAKLNRPAGIHKDQRRKSDPKQLRRDKSYKKEMH